MTTMLAPSAIDFSGDPYRRKAPAAPQPVSALTVEAGVPGMTAPIEEEDFGFDDFLDIVNPLQHLPIIGPIYRALSGDTIKTPAALAGGALFGGPLGFAGALITRAFEAITGETPETIVSALFEGEDKVSPAPHHAAAVNAYQRSAALPGLAPR